MIQDPLPCPFYVLPKDVQVHVDRLAGGDVDKRQATAMTLYREAARIIAKKNVVGVPVTWDLTKLGPDRFIEAMKAIVFVHIIRTAEDRTLDTQRAAWPDLSAIDQGIQLEAWFDAEGLSVSEWLSSLCTDNRP